MPETIKNLPKKQQFIRKKINIKHVNFSNKTYIFEMEENKMQKN